MKSARELADSAIAKQECPKLRVRVGTPHTSGKLAVPVIADTVRAAYGSISECFEQGTAKAPSLVGSIGLRFVIGTDGRVSHAEASPSSTLHDARVERCLIMAFEHLVFPRPASGIVTVVYPITVDPR